MPVSFSQRRLVDRRGKYRWLRVAVLAPAVVSVLVHAAGAIWVRAHEWARGHERVTDAPVVDTVLALEQPRRTPVTPPPQPLPAPVAPEPAPPRAEVREQPQRPPAPEPVRPAAPAPAVNPAPEPAPQTAPEPAPERAPSRPPAAATVPPPADAAPPRPASFAGVKADVAERVVYVVDASGAMTTSLNFVLEELARSLERLDESQLFQVVLFREPPPGEATGASSRGYEMFRPGDGLVPATRANKDAARAWARTIRPLGRSSPLPGLSAALSLSPDLVFLLSRSIQRTGTEPKDATLALLKTLEDLNPASVFTGRRPAVIKTIQFIDEDPSGLLPAIAARHGDGAGSYRLLSLEELTGR